MIGRIKVVLVFEANFKSNYEGTELIKQEIKEQIYQDFFIGEDNIEVDTDSIKVDSIEIYKPYYQKADE